LQYQWVQPQFLNNIDALKFVIDQNKPTATKAGITTYYEAELFQWDGSHWVKVA